MFEFKVGDHIVFKSYNWPWSYSIGRIVEIDAQQRILVQWFPDPFLTWYPLTWRHEFSVLSPAEVTLKLLTMEME